MLHQQRLSTRPLLRHPLLLSTYAFSLAHITHGHLGYYLSLSLICPAFFPFFFFTMGILSCRLPSVVLYRTLNHVYDELSQLEGLYGRLVDVRLSSL
jgi:hypothetical protein